MRQTRIMAITRIIMMTRKVNIITTFHITQMWRWLP